MKKTLLLTILLILSLAFPSFGQSNNDNIIVFSDTLYVFHIGDTTGFTIIMPGKSIVLPDTVNNTTTIQFAADVNFTGTVSGIAGSGTVTSVGLAAPSVFSVSGSPVSGAGTLTLGFAAGQTANRVLATPSGATGPLALRLISNEHIDASAAISYSKLNLSSSIVLGDMAITGTPDGTKYLRDDFSWQTVSGSGGDDVSVDGGAVTDPDFVSTDDIDFINTLNTITAAIRSGVIVNNDINGSAAIAQSKMANVTDQRLLGNVSGGTTTPQEVTAAEARTLINVEDGATTDQSDAEIETAYNNQVSVVSQAEAEAGVATTVRRWTAQRIAQAIAALETDTDTQLSEEQVEDFVGTMLSGTQTRITVTYTDGGDGAGVLNFVVSDVMADFPDSLKQNFKWRPDGNVAAGDTSLFIQSGQVIKDDVANLPFLASGDNATELDGTAWRIFYTDGSGNVTELAVGAASTLFFGNGATSVPGFAKISNLSEEVNPTTGDFLLGETSEGDAVKVNVGNLPTGGGGEANTLSSQGGGLALTAATPKSGVDLRTKSLSPHQFNTHADTVGLSLGPVSEALWDTLTTASIAATDTLWKRKNDGTFEKGAVSSMPFEGTLTNSAGLRAALNDESGTGVFLTANGDGSGLSGVVTSESDPIISALFDAHSVIYSVSDNTPVRLTLNEQTVLGRLTGGNISAVSIGIADNNISQIDGTPNSGEYARFAANGLEGRTEAEFKADFNLEADTDFYSIAAADATFLPIQTIGIANDNLLEVDGTPNSGEAAVFTANGINGLSEAEFKAAFNMEAGTDFESATSNDFDPDRLAGDIDDDNLVDGDIVEQASATERGAVELATAAETGTGTDGTRAVTPDGLAGSDYGKRGVSMLIFTDADDITGGNGAGDIFWNVPPFLSGYNLVEAYAYVQTAGTTNTTDIQVHNVTQAADMLSTAITIDSGEKNSSTAATPPVIDTNNDDVASHDEIRIDVDAVSTTAPKGLSVTLVFQLP